MAFTEDFLHYIWKYKRFDHQDLRCIEGASLTIGSWGVHNHGSGPDFHNGQVAIGNTRWAGNIEIHIRSSDWRKHRHHLDKSYDNVILHVVYEYDEPAYNTRGQELPTLELKDRIDPNVISRYVELLANLTWIPCAKQLQQVDPLIVHQAMDRALIQRLQRKSGVIEAMLKYYNNDWNKVCYQSIAASLGAKINQQPFEHLARITPLEVLAKRGDQLFQLEALLLGQAGLLGDPPQDEYHGSLIKEYRFLQHKYQLQPMKSASWQFSGLRPASFPHLRIVQFAKLISKYPTLFARLKSIENLQQVNDLFDIELEGYWRTHYHFTKTSKPKKKSIGKTVRNNLLINSIVPILFHYGDKMKDEEVKSRSLIFLENLSSERNSILRQWESLGVKSQSAYDSQALLELKNESCTFKKCLSCPIGVDLLKWEK